MFVVDLVWHGTGIETILIWLKSQVTVPLSSDYHGRLRELLNQSEGRPNISDPECFSFWVCTYYPIYTPWSCLTCSSGYAVKFFWPYITGKYAALWTTEFCHNRYSKQGRDSLEEFSVVTRYWLSRRIQATRMLSWILANQTSLQLTCVKIGHRTVSALFLGRILCF
jgi:hypothetical protein